VEIEPLNAAGFGGAADVPALSVEVPALAELPHPASEANIITAMVIKLIAFFMIKSPFKILSISF